MYSCTKPINQKVNLQVKVTNSEADLQLVARWYRYTHCRRVLRVGTMKEWERWSFGALVMDKLTTRAEALEIEQYKQNTCNQRTNCTSIYTTRMCAACIQTHNTTVKYGNGVQ